MKKFVTNPCPLCGAQMLRLDRSYFCPNEDPHPGGVVLYDDGLMRVAELPRSGTLPTSPKDGGASP